MSREKKYTGIILKKQAYGEGDEIVTFFTKENGKVRCLAKSVKKSLAKLQQKLQTLFQVEFFTTVSSSLPKIISAEPVAVFSDLRENLGSLQKAYVGVELLLKLTPDELKNEKLFVSFLEFLKYLNLNSNERMQSLALEKFKISILELSGMAIDFFPELEFSDRIFFSPPQGGFSESQNHNSLLVSKGIFKLFLSLHNMDYQDLNQIKESDSLTELERLTVEFVEYHLERQLKSIKFLN